MYSLTKVVRVIRPGVFNGPDNKRLPRADAGDVIEVAAGGYAESLIADGWVTDELSENIPEPELAERSPANSETEDHAPVTAKKPRRTKQAKDGE